METLLSLYLCLVALKKITNITLISLQVATQYDVSYIPPENGQYRTREAKRKRISKTDQEKYFADFPSLGEL